MKKIFDRSSIVLPLTMLVIEAHIRDIYGLKVLLDTTVNRIMDKVLPVAKKWQ